MASADRSLFYLVILFVIIIEKGSGLKCYVCKSSRDEACGFFATTDGVVIQECANSDDICFHIDYNVDGTEDYPQYVERKCVSPNFIICPSAYPGYVSCSACSTSLCNDESTTLKYLNFSTTDENNVGMNWERHMSKDGRRRAEEEEDDENKYESTSSTFKPTFILITIMLLPSSNGW